MAKSHKKRLEAKFGKKKQDKVVISKPVVTQEPKKEKKSFYNKYYKQLLIIPFVMLLAAFVLLGIFYAQTGSFVSKGISLSGGTAITITKDMTDLTVIDTVALEETLLADYPDSDINIRTQKQLTDIVAIEIEVDVTDTDQLEVFKGVIVDNIDGLTLEEASVNVRSSGSVIGQTFFSQIIKAMILAFIFMGIVVFIQFRVPIPSLAVILAAFSDIVVTLAVVNMLGIKLSTAGIAAFLMLIGYSVDTDILLSTRVLKNKEGTVYQRIISALKTGLTMNVTTLAAVTIALIVSQSQTITQIMTILLIGLIVDMINTWLQNAGILRWYAEKQELKNKNKGGLSE